MMKFVKRKTAKNGSTAKLKAINSKRMEEAKVSYSERDRMRADVCDIARQLLEEDLSKDAGLTPNDTQWEDSMKELEKALS